MADTARSVSALQALLADNTSGAISPQDLRDLLVSSLGVYGEIYVAGGSTPQGSIDTSYALITGFAANGLSSGTTPDHSSDQITVDVTGTYLVMANVCFTGTASTEFTVAVFAEGIEEHIHFCRSIGTGVTVGSAHLCGVLALTATDVVDLRVKADGASKSITVQEGAFTVRMIG
jgi:hypothetical protein